MGTHQHWDDVYTRRPAESVTWYQPHLQQSLAWIERHAPEQAARIVDAGAGASTLVDDLLARGYSNLALVDLSQEALAQSRARLGARAEEVDWVVDDVREAHFEAQSVDVSHDRAVFHFFGRPGRTERLCGRDAQERAARRACDHRDVCPQQTPALQWLAYAALLARRHR
ncbi:class I SAM-dependent methyltransferase [Lujinxingia vulgaris]|uniref:class I SAM-dependent methyltransferase n=1 Tax=Lujinxingia vulgaris TaxID=2600176 RepID=UPI001E30ACA6|nr:class I SAM-dependent methyltransferase [Lujinxingia vulgaris]